MNNIRGTVAQRNANAAAQSNSIAGFIHKLQPEIERALPKHMTGDRMARLLLTAVRQTPKLGQCDLQSFAGAVLTAAALGLEPNTPNGEAYLIPYGRECTFVAGYQGLTKLFYQSPLAKHIYARAVFEGDDFDYAYGLDPYLRHRPTHGERGNIIYYYAAASLQSGASDFVVLTPDEVKALRGGKVGPSGKIPDPMHWMERKTALRQLLKTLPKSTSLAAAISADEVNGSTLRGRQLGQPVEQAPEITGPAQNDDDTDNSAKPHFPTGINPETGEVDDDYIDAEFMDEPEEAGA